MADGTGYAVLNAIGELAAERRAHYYTKQNLQAHQEDEVRLKDTIRQLRERIEILEAREEAVSNFLRNF